MNRNMADTRKWYIEHGMHAEYVKKYICVECQHCETCYGLTDRDTRVHCKEFTFKSIKEPAKWDVSYNRVPAYGSLTLAQRIRREG